MHWGRAEKKAEEILKPGGEEKLMKQSQSSGVPMGKLNTLYLQLGTMSKQHCFRLSVTDKQCVKADTEADRKDAQECKVRAMTRMAKPCG